MEGGHVLLVTFPAQGHINPALRFAKRLLAAGVEVTFPITISARRRMEKTATGPTPDGLSFALFSDGHDDGIKPGQGDAESYMTEFRRQGSLALRDAIVEASGRGHPVTFLIYTLLLPWASAVASEFCIPCALLWIQPATVLNLYYHYFHGALGDISHNGDPSWNVRLPGLDRITFSERDLPSFVLPSSSDKHTLLLRLFKEQLDMLDAESRPTVLVNTFDALETDALRTIECYKMISIGPLVDIEDPSSQSSFQGSLFQRSHDCIEWLDTKPASSVVYVSFGSLINLEKPQVEEIASGLLGSGRPFLWVVRPATDDDSSEESIGQLEELQKQGLVVGWCPQAEVLAHVSVGCFVTHCGWNSTLESLWCGVPVVAVPVWSDQGTNAKLIEDVWGSGVRVGLGLGFGEDGRISGEEITRCIERVMDGGEKSVEVRENAGRWKDLARAAVGANGSSDRNMKAFIEGCGGGL